MLGEITLRGANLGKKMYSFENRFNIILGVGFIFFFLSSILGSTNKMDF